VTSAVGRDPRSSDLDRAALVTLLPIVDRQVDRVADATS